MNSVFDASVILAILRDEITIEGLAPLFQRAWISSVNLVEVLSRFDELGMSRRPRAEDLLGLLAGVHPFTEPQARIAASLRRSTRDAGLSLGDRACIALAMELDAEVYTADRAWARVKLPCRVHLIR